MERHLQYVVPVFTLGAEVPLHINICTFSALEAATMVTVLKEEGERGYIFCLYSGSTHWTHELAFVIDLLLSPSDKHRAPWVLELFLAILIIVNTLQNMLVAYVATGIHSTRLFGQNQKHMDEVFTVH